MSGRLVISLALALAALAPGVQAQSRAERRRQKLLEKLGQRFDAPVAVLDAAKAERFVAPDAAEREAFLRDLGRRPRGELLPLVVHAALEDPEFTLREAAVRLLSTVALEADRRLYLEVFLPALPRLYADPADRIFLRAADEANHLAPWFACDHAVVDLLERTFRGDEYRLAQKAFFGLVALEAPDLREGVVRRALLEALDPKTRFAVFERKRAVLEAGRRGGLATPRQLAELLFADGTVAIECAEALGALGDPQVLPALRRVDRTASHKLRLPVYRTRARLNDEQLLADVNPAFASDHEAIRAALVDALGRLASPRARPALARLAEVVSEPALRRGVALARLRQGDAADRDLLAEALRGGDADRGLAREVLGLEASPEVGDLVLLVARNARLGGVRAAAVDRLGELGGAAPAGAGELLRALSSEGDASPLRLRAAASLLQLGDPAGVAHVTSALTGLDVVLREDVPTGLGKPARRFRGSHLGPVCARWADGAVAAAVPLMARWLNPPEAAAAATTKEPEPEDDGATRTRTRRPRRQDDAPTRPPPRFPDHVRHPFVRREVVRSLGRLVASLPEEAPERAQGIAALARALDDPAGVVRAAATLALARISGAAELAPGAALEREEEAAQAIRAWLAGR